MGKKNKNKWAKRFKKDGEKGESLKTYKARFKAKKLALAGLASEALAKPVAPPKTPEKPFLDAVSGNLEGLTVPELRSIAREKSIKGYSTMRKDQLITALT